MDILTALDHCPARYPRWCSDWLVWIALGVVWIGCAGWWVSRRLPGE